MQSNYDLHSVASNLTSRKAVANLQLATAGFFVLGIIVMIIGCAMFGCGVVDIVVGIADSTITGFLPGILKTISGVFTLINGLICYKVSLKAVLTLKRMKTLFVTTSIALVLHVTDFVLSALGIFNAYIKFGDQLLSTCNRDANSFATVVADSGYSGANLNPNYNPNCGSTNSNCNIDAYPILNYNFNYWYSQMQNYILTLYNYYRYVFRYSFEVDALHVMFASEMMIIEVALLIIVGHFMNHIEESEKLAEETVVEPDPRLIGSQMAIPHNRSADTSAPPPYPGNTDANSKLNEPIYVNVRAQARAANGRHSPGGVGQNSSWSVYSHTPHDPGQSIYSLNVAQGPVSQQKF